MKYASCLLLAIFFCCAGCSAAANPPCQQGPANSKTTDTTTVKKAPVKITPVAPQQGNKQAPKKETKKQAGDYVSPLSWRPTLVY